MQKAFSGVVVAMALALSLAVLSLVAGPLLVAPAGAAERWTPPTGGFFNNPWGNRDSKFRIERQIVEAIKHARKGSHIRVAVYSFDRMNVAKALVKAHERGVRVQVLHNDHIYTDAMRLLKKRLGTDRDKKSWDYTCKTGCRSKQGVLHDKIYLFEHTGAARNVVMTGSANLTRNATVHQFNDLLVKKEAPRLYGALLDLFRELKRDKQAHPLFEHKVFRDHQLWVMPHPRTRKKNDPIMNILSKVRCAGATGDTGINGRTKIRVSMHSWNGERGVYIAERLRHLYAHGCNVKVMWALAGRGMKQTLAKETRRGVLRRHANGYNTDCDELREVDMYSHQKYMTISGHYGDDRSASFVFTGSSNWTPQGMSGDELILRVKGRGVVKSWNTNFQYIWQNRSREVGGDGGFRPTPPYCPYYYRSGVAPRRATSTGLTFSGHHWEND